MARNDYLLFPFRHHRTIELLKFLSTDYGRGYLSGLASGLSILLKFLKKAE